MGCAPTSPDRVFAFVRVGGLNGWSQDTAHRVTGSAAFSGNDQLRWRGSSAQPPSKCPSLSARLRVVLFWKDVRRQSGREAEGDEAEEADDPERMRPGGFGGCE
jgi:hypothetical protein